MFIHLREGKSHVAAAVFGNDGRGAAAIAALPCGVKSAFAAASPTIPGNLNSIKTYDLASFHELPFLRLNEERVRAAIRSNNPYLSSTIKVQLEHCSLDAYKNGDAALSRRLADLAGSDSESLTRLAALDAPAPDTTSGGIGVGRDSQGFLGEVRPS